MKIDNIIELNTPYCNMVSAYQLKKYDVFCIFKNFGSDFKIKVGSSYLYPFIKVKRIYYHRRKWWQFWKRNVVAGLQLVYTGD